MKCLTLTQPWATLVAIGAKQIETRSWSTSYRGPLAIHAGTGLGPVDGRRGLHALCGAHPFCDVLLPAGYSAMRVPAWGLPLGAIVATCELVDVWPIAEQGEYQTEISDGQWGFNHWHTVTEPELSFGDYTPGRYAWLLGNVQPLATPIPAKGALGLWQYAGAL